MYVFEQIALFTLLCKFWHRIPILTWNIEVQTMEKTSDLLFLFKQRTLLKFDDIRFGIFQDSLLEPEIINATIRLYVRGIVTNHEGWKDSEIAIHELDNNFCEDTATWDCRDIDENDCCVPWRMLGFYPNVPADYSWRQSDVQNIYPGIQSWLNLIFLLLT